MMLFFRLERIDPQADLFLFKFIERLGAGWNATNKPFDPARLTKIKGLWILELEPTFPAFWIYGLIFSGLVLFFHWSLWLLIPAGLVISTAAFWHSSLYGWALKMGLRKAGSRTKVSIVNVRDAVRQMAWDK